MGYETKMYIGTKSSLKDKDGDSTYFLKMAMVDLCKCGYDGALPDLISKAVCEENPNGYEEVHWSEPIKINKEKVTPSLIELGVEEDGIDDIYEAITDWESRTDEDCYGSKLRAVPFKEVYKALKKSQAECIVSDGVGYRRYTIALGLFNGISKGFNGGKDLFVVLYGY